MLSAVYMFPLKSHCGIRKLYYFQLVALLNTLNIGNMLYICGYCIDLNLLHLCHS